MPSAMVRFAGGKARPTTPNTMPKPVHDMPIPTSSPALRLKSQPGLRVGHQRESQRVAQRAGDQGARRAVLVGDHAGEGAREP